MNAGQSCKFRCVIEGLNHVADFVRRKQYQTLPSAGCRIASTRAVLLQAGIRTSNFTSKVCNPDGSFRPAMYTVNFPSSDSRMSLYSPSASICSSRSRFKDEILQPCRQANASFDRSDDSFEHQSANHWWWLTGLAIKGRHDMHHVATLSYTCGTGNTSQNRDTVRCRPLCEVWWCSHVGSAQGAEL